MVQKNDYRSAAKAHETAFRAILDAYGIPHGELTVEQIYEKYSTGDRYGIWTILDFAERDGLFVFSSEDIAFMSGCGSSAIWKIEDGKAVHVENEMAWMS